MKNIKILLSAFIGFIFCAQAHATVYDFKVIYGGPGVYTSIGSNNPLISPIVVGDQFTYSLLAHGNDFWSVDADSPNFLFALLSLNSGIPGPIRTFDFSLTFWLNNVQQAFSINGSPVSGDALTPNGLVPGNTTITNQGFALGPGTNSCGVYTFPCTITDPAFTLNSFINGFSGPTLQFDEVRLWYSLISKDGGGQEQILTLNPVNGELGGPGYPNITYHDLFPENTIPEPILSGLLVVGFALFGLWQRINIRLRSAPIAKTIQDISIPEI